MKVVVTGGAGFIGSHLVKYLLQENHEVVAVDNLKTGSLANLGEIFHHPSFTFIEEDIRNKEKMIQLMENVNWVFHLAALASVLPSFEHPSEYFEVNVQGTLNLLEAARIAKVNKFIYAASCSCYDPSCNIPISETAPICPETPYGLTKHLGEQLAMHWAKIYHLPTISLRLFNVYGPSVNKVGPYAAVINTFLDQKFHNKPFTVRGNGKQIRDFIFITDVVSAFNAAALSSISGEIFNAGTSQATEIIDLAKIIKGKIIHVPKLSGELEYSLADITKIKKYLNWVPKISLEEGLKLFVQKKEAFHAGVSFQT